jgi:hypothetical protein
MFGKDLKVIDATPRTLEDQLRVKEGNINASSATDLLGLGVAPVGVRLRDDGEVWISPPPLTVNLRFEKKGGVLVLAEKGVGYHLACDKLKSLRGHTREEFEGELRKLALGENYEDEVKKATEAALAPASKSKGQTKTSKEETNKNPTVKYPSPDLKEQTLTVTYGSNDPKNAKVSDVSATPSRLSSP